jgi:hypothetical protein
MSQAFASPLVHIRRVEFKGQLWIGVSLPKRADYIALIRQIEGRVWKREFKLWLLPYSKEAYRQLNALFPGLIHTGQSQSPAAPQTPPLEQVSSASFVTRAEPTPAPKPVPRFVPVSGTAPISRTAPVTKPVPSASEGNNSNAGGKVKAVLTGSKIVLQLPRHEPDLQFLRSLQGARWDPSSLTWQVSDSETNRRLIVDYFGERLLKMVPKKHSTLNKPPG